MLLFLLIPFLYFAVGTFAARIYVASAKAIDPNIQKDEAAQGLDAINHGSNCWHGRRHGQQWRTSNHNCDCHSSRHYAMLIKQWRSANDIEMLPNPYPMVFAWPFLGYHKFLMSGTPKPSAVEISNETRINQLEKELEISR